MYLPRVLQSSRIEDFWESDVTAYTPLQETKEPKSSTVETSIKEEPQLQLQISKDKVAESSDEVHFISFSFTPTSAIDTQTLDQKEKGTYSCTSATLKFLTPRCTTSEHVSE